MNFSINEFDFLLGRQSSAHGFAPIVIVVVIEGSCPWVLSRMQVVRTCWVLGGIDGAIVGISRGVILWSVLIRLRWKNLLHLPWSVFDVLAETC